MGDLRLALRALRATPLLSTMAVLSIALGIGANTGVFSLVDALLLRPLPVASPHRLFTVSSDFALSHGYRNGIGWSYDTWRRFQRRVGAFDGAFAWTWAPLNLAARGQADRVHGMLASGGFFTTLGVPAFIGRAFTDADDARGGGSDGPVAVISYAFWQHHFNGAASVLGTRLELDRVPFTVIGVTPPGFFGIEVGESLDVVVPLGTDALLKGSRTLLDHPNALLLTVMLRLAPGQSRDAATAAMRAMQPDILDAGHTKLPRFATDPFVLVPAATGSTDKSQLRQRYEQPLMVVAVIVGLVLLIGCANIANLLIARSAARQHDFSVRVALGATRWRLARQLLTESLVLAGVGAAGGLLIAVWSSRALVSQLSTSTDPVFLSFRLDWRTGLFTAAITLLAALLFGTGPAWRMSRASSLDALRERGRSSSGPRRTRVYRGLVVAQVAAAFVLLSAAGLFIGTFDRLGSVPVGFNPNGMAVATIDTSRASVASGDPDRGAGRFVSSIVSLPGIAQAAASLATPGPGGAANLITDARGRVIDGGRRVLMNAVTPRWFSTYALPLRAGRDIADTDTANSLPVAVVNETFARVFFPAGHALGAEFDDGSTSRPTRTIVGIVADAIYGSSRDRPSPTAYVPLAQSAGLGPSDRTSLQISFRAVDTPRPQLFNEVARALSSADGGASFSFRLIGDGLYAALAQERLIAMLTSVFGVLAALLACLGLYGVTAQRVSSRRMEIGVRLALGGSSGQVVGLLLFETVRLVVLGVTAGMALTLWLSPLVTTLLYGIRPRDPIMLMSSAALLVAAALIAAWLPARRALHVSPVDLLRGE